MRNTFIELAVFSVGSLVDESRVHSVLTAVNAAGLTPTTWGFSEPLKQKYDPAKLDGLSKLWGKEGERCIFKFGRQGLMTINTKTAPLPGFQSVRIQLDYTTAQPILDELRDLLRDLCSIWGADYGCLTLSGGNPFSVDVQNAEANVGEVAGVRIPPASPNAIKFLNGIWWINYFGPSYVSFFGAEVIQSLPTVQTELDGHGGCWLQVTERPEEAWTEDGQTLAREIKQLLNRPTAFYGHDPSKPGFMLQYTTPDFNRLHT